MNFRKRVASSPAAGLAGFLLRSRIALLEWLRAGRVLVRWTTSSRETTNFNYPLTEVNELHLAWFVAEVCACPVSRVQVLFDELRGDASLRRHIVQRTEASAFKHIADPEPAYGRRLAWYAIARVLQPDLVVETGTEKGLGACVLAAALRKNGHGRVVAVDIAVDSGWLAQGTDLPVEVVHEDSSRWLAAGHDRIAMFVHDVHATEEQEEEEYRALLPRLDSRAVIINDNAHGYAVLPKLCERFGWRYLHFREQPLGHWYQGAGMGAAIVDSQPVST